MSKISGIENIGRCVDLVVLDPLDIVSSCKVVQAILPKGGDDTYPIGDDLVVPKGIEVMSPFKLTVSGGETLMSNSYDFTESFENTITVEGGFAGLGFTGSNSVKKIQKDSASREEVFTYVFATSAIHVLRLSLSGVSAKYLLLNQDLRESVATLPVSDDEAAYALFIKEFGTHFISQVALGGMAWSRVSSEKVSRKLSKEDETEFKAGATAEIESFKSGVSTTETRKKLAESDSKRGISRSQITFVGGTGDTAGIASAWVESLDKKSVPIHEKLILTRLSSLLTASYFPDDESIAKKKNLLEVATARYIKQKGGDEGLQIRYGYPIKLETLAGRKDIYCSTDVSSRPFLHVHDPAKMSSDKLARFEIIGPRQKKGEPVMTGDGVTLKIFDSKTCVVIGHEMVTTNVPPFQTLGAFLKTSESPMADGEYLMRIMGSQQEYKNNGSSDKSRPLISGDIVMISRYDIEIKRFVHIYGDLNNGNVRTERALEDWLFTQNDSKYYFVVRNA